MGWQPSFSDVGVEVSSSTKNSAVPRDPGAHQAKRGNDWHFGYKAHAGADAGSGLVHACMVTPANASDVAMAHGLFRDDEFGYADAGHVRMTKCQEFVDDGHLSRMESMKSAVRSKIEHPHYLVKRVYGFWRTRYRGIQKN